MASGVAAVDCAMDGLRVACRSAAPVSVVETGGGGGAAAVVGCAVLWLSLSSSAVCPLAAMLSSTFAASVGAPPRRVLVRLPRPLPSSKAANAAESAAAWDGAVMACSLPTVCAVAAMSAVGVDAVVSAAGSTIASVAASLAAAAAVSLLSETVLALRVDRTRFRPPPAAYISARPISANE